MANSNLFEADDFEFSENIEKLFHEYVALFIQLHYPSSGHAVSDEERRDLTLKLRKAANDMTVLGINRKRFKSDAESVNYPHVHQPSSVVADLSLIPAFN